ncbi:lipocalin family protein [Flavobacterium sp. FlaQc-48]|uniref:lipocalin family protein n=1 Tax=Flavobacterium sp. FlaQc-48 TaxID=3374181 RepID=UPI0037572C54
MRKFIFFLFFIYGLTSYSQTSTELIGKWKLVKWTQRGKDKDITEYYKTDQVYQVFQENNRFQSIVGDKTHDGKWKLSKNNDELTIISGLFTIPFKIDYFDSKKRIITTDQLGTLEYQKVL